MASSLASRPPQAWPLWLPAAGGALAVLAAHVPQFVHRLLDGDEAVYASIAALMNQGGSLYGNAGVDNKPPGIFWTYAATFDVFGAYQMTAIHVVGLVVMAATCVTLFYIGLYIAGPRAGLIAAILYGLLTAAGNPRLLASNTELFMTLPLTVAFLLMLRRRWLWSGLLMVVAGAFKQVAAAEVLLLPVGLVLLETKEARIGAALRFAAGVVVGLAAGAAALAVTGSLAGFWRWTIETLVGYAQSNLTIASIASRASDSIVPFVVSSIVLWIAAAVTIVRWRSLWPAERLAVAWFVASALGAVVGGHWSWHYFIQVMPPLALLAALAADRALQTKMRAWYATALLAGMVVPSVYWAAFDFQADPLTYDWSPPIAQHQQVADYIRAHTTPGEKVFVWGDWPSLYVESDRLMAGRFPGFLRGFARSSGLPPNNWDTSPDVWPALQSDLRANPPALIVDTAAAGWSDFSSYPMADFPVLAQLVSSEYHQVATVDGVVIYARNT